jgi:hypothetical protein
MALNSHAGKDDTRPDASANHKYLEIQKYKCRETQVWRNTSTGTENSGTDSERYPGMCVPACVTVCLSCRRNL